MNKSVLIIEMPNLRNEDIIGIYNFLHELMNAFENHYFDQLRDYHRALELNNIDDIFEEFF